MEDLLQALMQGSQQQSSESSPGNTDPLIQMLQSMGGGAAQGYGPQTGYGQPQGEMDLGSLLQGAMGGGGGYAGGAAPMQSSGAGGLGDLLAAIMGGGSQTLQSNSILAPIVNRIAEKIGLPPQLAQAVVAFVLGKLVERRMQPGIATTEPTQPQAAGQRGPSLDTVVQRMNSGKKVKKTQIRSAGLADELASYTGMNRTTAEASLQEALNALGGQLGTGQ